MRKVNLRNVDPAIDDPDASTWCKCPFSLDRACDSDRSLTDPGDLQHTQLSTAILPLRSSQTSSVVYLLACLNPVNAMPMSHLQSLRLVPRSDWAQFLSQVHLPRAPPIRWPPLQSPVVVRAVSLRQDHSRPFTKGVLPHGAAQTIAPLSHHSQFLPILLICRTPILTEPILNRFTPL